MTSGDKTRISQIRTWGFLTEDFSYDSESRVSQYEQTVDYRGSYPMTVDYMYDSFDRIKEVELPAQYGNGGGRKMVRNAYDQAGRLTSIKYGTLVSMSDHAGDFVFNASGQTTSMKIGSEGANQVTEQYTFDAQTGLMTNQKAIRAGNILLDLSYDYSLGNSVGSGSGKTGAVTKIVDNLNNNKNKEYEFDALGRLTKAKGGVNGALWFQKYSFDRYGNRTNVVKAGNGIDGNPIPLDGLPGITYDTASNRITSSGFQYDAAGNQITGFREDGTAITMEYDAANRLQIIKRASDGFMLQAFQYTSTNARLMDYDTGVGLTKIFASVGGTVVAEYAELQHTVPTWTKGYTYLGDSLLATITPAGSGNESVEFNHPDRLSTKLITNPQTGGNSEQAHLPFGKALNSESTITNNPKRFTSYDRSGATGFDYAINRTYDSKQGRFTQVDPIGMEAASLSAPQTLNLYTYCGNDPVNRVDPDGLFWGWIKKFFSWIVNTIRTSKLVRRIVVRFVVSFVMSGGNLGVAVRSVVPDILRKLGLNPGTTPPWLPGSQHPVTTGEPSSLGKYIILNILGLGRRGDLADNLLVVVRTAIKNLPDLIRNILANRRGALADEVTLCHAAIESGMLPGAKGAAGEIGLFQLKPGTAKELFPLYGSGNFSEAKVYEVGLNTRMGTGYLDSLYTKFNKDLTSALGAYKQGARSVSKKGLTPASKEYAAAVNKCADELIRTKELDRL